MQFFIEQNEYKIGTWIWFTFLINLKNIMLRWEYFFQSSQEVWMSCCVYGGDREI